MRTVSQKMWGILGFHLLFPAYLIGAQLVLGDLNSDGVKDVAEIVWKKKDSAPILVVTFKRKDGATLAKLESPKAICLGCGGPKAIMGEPLGELSIHRGVLWISYEGGSRSVWKDIVKWRFDKVKKDFILVGETYEITDNLGEYPKERLDINFSTAMLDHSVGKTQKRCRFDASKKTTLSSFDFENKHLSELETSKKICLVSATP